MIHVIRNKKTGEEVQRFEGLTERGFRGLLMKVDSTRFKVDIHGTKTTADEGTIKAIAAAAAKRRERHTLRSAP